MSLNATLRTAPSGLNAAQMGLRGVSGTTANLDAPGYARKTLDQRPPGVAGQGTGVQVAGARRIAEQYLTQARQTAAGDYSRWSSYAQHMDTIQGLYGDPSGDSFFFTRLDTIFSGFAAAADDPASAQLRRQAVSNVQDFLNDAQRISTRLTQLSDTMDTRIGAHVAQANDLLQRIRELNSGVAEAKLTEQDASGAANMQAQLADQLAGLIGVRVSPRAGGGVDVRAPDGRLLAGESHVTLTYAAGAGAPGYLAAITSEGGAPQPLQLDGGAVRGLLDLRNIAIPQMSDQLGEFVERTVSQLNAAHNASSAAPAPATLAGRNTGLDLETAASGFTGRSTLALVDSSGVIQRRVTIDFDAMTFSVNGGPAAGFSAGAFDSDLTAALGGMGSASFSNGVLSITASGGLGVAIDEGASQKAGKAFSHFFGLNDLIRSNAPGAYDTGLTFGDAHGFSPGDSIAMRLSRPEGRPLRDVTVRVPAGGTMGDLVAALNNSASGVGLYGSFGLDRHGRLSFTGAQPANAQLSMVRDETSRGTGGPSFSQLFGVGDGERASRAARYKLDPAIAGNPARRAFAHLDLAAAAGAPALRAGDARGALALAGAGEVNTNFGAAGGRGALTMTLARYASEFARSIAGQAAAAHSRADAAEAVTAEAEARRQSVESVSLDEELVKLTTYQQAFNASARMTQAAKELIGVLAR